MDYLPQLLAIQQQVNALIEQMQGATPAKKADVPVAPGAPKKKRGRPSKKDLEAAAEAAAIAADAILAAGEPVSEAPKKRGPQTAEAKAAAVAKRKATMERKKAEKAAEDEAMKRASEADEDAESVVSSASTTSSKPKLKLVKKAVAVAKAEPTPEPLVDEDTEEETKEERNNRIIYNYMFRLQESGVCNMMESGAYLKRAFGLSTIEAEDYVLDYMSSYEALYTKYGTA